jgi:Protein of unknown function (DUF2867)
MQELKISVQTVAMPSGASIAHLYPGSNLADAYAVNLPHQQACQMTMDNLARHVLGSQPGWAQSLMRLRDTIVKPLGIKTATQLASSEGGRIGIFRIYAVTDDEIIVGEDDSHLDFRLSLLRDRQAGPHGNITLASVVHCHNKVGRAYIALIKPFHKLIVQRSLARAVQGSFG